MCDSDQLAETERDRVKLHLSVPHKLCSGWATKPHATMSLVVLAEC